MRSVNESFASIRRVPPMAQCVAMGAQAPTEG